MRYIHPEDDILYYKHEQFYTINFVSSMHLRLIWNEYLDIFIEYSTGIVWDEIVC